MAVVELTSATLSETVEKENVVLVDFWAPWCGPCKRLAPVLDEVAKTLEDKQVVVAKVNIDDYPDVASQFGIMSIPTMLIFKDGTVVDKLIGLQSKEDIVAAVKKHL